jgi:hypothetical protein
MKATWHGQVIAESTQTIELDGYHYFPPASVRTEFLQSAGEPFEGAEAAGTLHPSISVPQRPCPIQQPRSTSNRIIRLFGQYGVSVMPH